MDNKKPTVVVFSRKYPSALSLIRALGMAGYTVDLFAAKKKNLRMDIARASRWLNRYIQSDATSAPKGQADEVLLQDLLAYAAGTGEKAVLLPTGSFTVNFIDRNREALEPYFILPGIIGGGNDALASLTEESLQRKMARGAGLNVRLEWTFPTGEEPRIPDDIVFPCVCTRISETSGKAMKSVICADEADFTAYFSRLLAKEARGTVRVWELQHPTEEIEIPGVCMDQQILMPGVLRKRSIGAHDDCISQVGTVELLGDLEPIREKLENLLRALHYTGMFNIHLQMVEGFPYFAGLSFYCSHSSYALLRSGVNLAASYVAQVCGLPEEPGVLTPGKTFLYEKRLWDDFSRGRITRAELDIVLATVDITLIRDPEDPEPEKLYTTQARKTMVKGKLRVVKRRIKKTLVPPLRKLKHIMLGYPQTKAANVRNLLSAKPRVLVAGRNYCSNLCLARAFGQAGYEVEVLRIFQAQPKKHDLMKALKPDAYSKYVKAYHVCVTRWKNDRIIQKLKAIADKKRKMLLVPADDLVANVVDGNMNKLRSRYIMANVNDEQGGINRLMSKSIQKELAEQFGLPVINSCVIRTENGAFTIPESVTYPCFIKPNISKNGLKSRMRKCDTAEELAGYLTEFSRKKDIEMLVQDYVEIGREFSILGVSTKDGAIGPGFFGAMEGGHAGRRGVALTGEVVDADVRRQLIDDIMAFVGSLGFEGLFDVDLIETKDGKMYFVELNMRFGGSGYAITASGVNLPGMFADHMLLGKPIDMDCRLEEPGKRFVSEKIMLEEYMEGFLDLEDVRRHMDEADIHFIKDDADPKPYQHFRQFFALSGPYRMMYKARAAKAAKQAAE